jgi:hypothetical protein
MSALKVQESAIPKTVADCSGAAAGNLKAFAMSL